MELTQFEKDVVTLVVKNECPQSLDEIRLLSVSSRETTQAGAYIHFHYKADSIKPTITPAFIGSSIAISIEGLKGGAGCVLFFEKGKITLLELFSYGDHSYNNHWPEVINDYQLETVR